MKEHYNCFYSFNDENLFINSSETQGIYPNIIEKIVEQLDICLDLHKRVLVVRFDLSLDEYSGDNQTISTFINRQKQRMFKTYRVKNIGHAWKKIGRAHV